MDTSELIEQLHNRIEETSRDRDRLAEAIVELNRVIAQLEVEEQTVARLVKQFGGASSDRPEHDTAGDGQSRPDDLNVYWPTSGVGAKPIKVKKLKAWARYKLDAADWYLGTLQAMTSENPKLTRVVGLEMAVDGIIQSLTATYEAAIYALTTAVERAASVPKDRRTPMHLANWSKLAAAAKFFGIDLASSLSISDALIGEHLEAPQGWLAQLLVLRHRSTLQDVLVVNKHLEPGSDALYVEVPGRGTQPLVGYLTEMRSMVAELLETILQDITDARKGRLFTSEIDQLRVQAEHDLKDLLTMDRLSDA